MELQRARVTYDNWDAAFRGLVPSVRQQSVRVAGYAHELFVAACSSPFARRTAQSRERIHGRYTDVVYKCGLYHQLGKALVPPEYQLLQPDFTDEEQQLYRKYTSDGRVLVATLQLKAAKSRSRKKERFEEKPTDNLPWLMIRESCEQHMERWDGSGYPHGLQGDEISAVAQIVGLARELDELSATTRSETPFDEALETLCAQAGTRWSPDLIAVLNACRDKCREVYEKYIHYTMTLPKTIPLVDRSPDRVMGLSYRPVIGAPDERVVAYEATPWFAGIAGHPGEIERLADLDSLLRSTELFPDVTMYFLYEAADTILRMRNCRLDVNQLILEVPDGFYKANVSLKEFTQLYEDQPIDRSWLRLTVSESLIKNANKATLQTISRYLKNDIPLVLDGFHPDLWEPEELKELGFRCLRLAPEACFLPETESAVQALRTWGFSLWASGVDVPERTRHLFDNGVEWVSGPVVGSTMSENEMIRDEIVRQQR